MDTQDPTTDPAISLLGVFIQRKRCYDVTLSRQEGSTTRHLASAQYWTGLAGGNTGRLFLMFGGPVCADRISYCPLDRVLTYKNFKLSIILLKYLQFACVKYPNNTLYIIKNGFILIMKISSLILYVHFKFKTCLLLKSIFKLCSYISLQRRTS